MEVEVVNRKKKYKPPLNLFWIRLISFIVLVISLTSIIIVTNYFIYSINKIIKIDSDIELEIFINIFQKRIAIAGPILNAISVIKYLSLALIAITSFALLYGSKNLNKMLIIRALLALISYLFLVFIIKYPLDFVLRKIFSVMYNGIDNAEEIIDMSVAIGSVFCATSFANTNIFIDIFIMTLFYYFLFKEINTKRKWQYILFRLCAIIPFIYLGVCIFLKNQSIMDLSQYDTYLLPLFATRKVPIYAFYLLTCLFFKIYRHKKNNDPSPLLFSIIISSILAFVALIEFIFSFFPNLAEFGLGNNYLIVVGIPIILLFNYQKSSMTLKTKIILFSIVGIMFLVIGVFAGFVCYQMIMLLIPIINYIAPYLSMIIDGLFESSE